MTIKASFVIWMKKLCLFLFIYSFTYLIICFLKIVFIESIFSNRHVYISYTYTEAQSFLFLSMFVLTLSVASTWAPFSTSKVKICEQEYPFFNAVFPCWISVILREKKKIQIFVNLCNLNFIVFWEGRFRNFFLRRN